jgi:hypothetical protein
VLNLAFSHPDLLTGVNPATGKPQLYGSVGVDINCAVIGYTATAPKTLAPQPARIPVPTQVARRPCVDGQVAAAAPFFRPRGR